MAAPGALLRELWRVAAGVLRGRGPGDRRLRQGPGLSMAGSPGDRMVLPHSGGGTVGGEQQQPYQGQQQGVSAMAGRDALGEVRGGRGLTVDGA